jgi:hypothetical protein
MEIKHLQHALEKQIPDIRHGCTINTAEGDLIITGHDADQLAYFLQTLFIQKLNLAQANKDALK